MLVQKKLYRIQLHFKSWALCAGHQLVSVGRGEKRGEGREEGGEGRGGEGKGGEKREEGRGEGRRGGEGRGRRREGRGERRGERRQKLYLNLICTALAGSWQVGLSSSMLLFLTAANTRCCCMQQGCYVCTTCKITAFEVQWLGLLSLKANCAATSYIQYIQYIQYNVHTYTHIRMYVCTYVHTYIHTYIHTYRSIRCTSQNTETVIQTFRQPTAAFISE